MNDQDLDRILGRCLDQITAGETRRRLPGASTPNTRLSSRRCWQPAGEAEPACATTGSTRRPASARAPGCCRQKPRRNERSAGRAARRWWQGGRSRCAAPRDGRLVVMLCLVLSDGRGRGQPAG